MTLVDCATRKIPDYYPTMFLDGYKPYEILYALHKSMREDFIEDDSVDGLVINSRIEVNNE